MKFTLDDNHKAELEKLANSGMTPILIAQRAKILLLKDAGKSATAIADEVGVSRHTAELWIKKYRNRSEEDSIEDLINVGKGRGRREEITGEAKTWLISVACTQPKDFGYAAETWTTKALTEHINKTAAEEGFDRLSTITESGVYRILDKCKIKPFRIQYYCERRDPDFGEKMHNVLLVYKQLEMQFDEGEAFSHSMETRQSTSYRMTRSPEYRRLQTSQTICRPRKSTAQSSAITNTSASAQYPCLQESTCRQEKPYRLSVTATTARITSNFLRYLMPDIRREIRSGWCSTTSRFTRPRRSSNICPL